MADNEEHHFRTADLYYAAYLRVAKVPLIDTERQGKRLLFVFERTPALKDLKRDFYSWKGKVDALTYANEIKTMKSLTYSHSS